MGCRQAHTAVVLCGTVVRRQGVRLRYSPRRTCPSPTRAGDRAPSGRELLQVKIAMRRSLTVLVTGGLLLLSSLAFAGSVSAATIAATTTCSNGVANTGGMGLICQVTVVNTITASGGTARVTLRECHGAAGDPQAACSTRVTYLSRPVTAVTRSEERRVGK